MLLKVPFDGVDQRDEDEGEHPDRQYRMRTEEQEVCRTNPSLSRKLRDAHLEVVNQVTHQEEDANAKRRQHTCPVRGDFLALDENESSRQEDRTGGVQTRVDRRQIAQLDGHRWLASEALERPCRRPGRERRQDYFPPPSSRRRHSRYSNQPPPADVPKRPRNSALNHL